MITLQDLFQFLHHMLNADAFSDGCINGIQIEGKKQIKKAAFAVSTSLESVEQAVDLGVDALIVHHGLFWNKEAMEIKGAKKSKLKKLLEKEISLLAYHLPLDAHHQVGNNWKAAKDLGLEEISAFEGIGAQGKLASIEIGTFISRLEKYYDHPAHAALGGKKRIESVAIVSGGAHRLLDKAVEAGVDCFVTGSFDEPIYHMAFDEKIHFAALGHHATERVGVKALKTLVEKELNIECIWVPEKNPF